MSTRSPISIGVLLGPAAAALSDLLERAARRGRLEAAIRERLPVELAPHCHLGNWENGTLVLVAESPAWAARLRYLAPQLQAGLRDLLPLRTVRVRAAPLAQRPPRTERRTRTSLSPDSARLLRDSAADLDGPLADALRRLARHAENHRQ